MSAQTRPARVFGYVFASAVTLALLLLVLLVIAVLVRALVGVVS